MKGTKKVGVISTSIGLSVALSIALSSLGTPPAGAGIPAFLAISPQNTRNWPNRLQHIQCLRALGACASTRSAGLASDEEMSAYNSRCRLQTRYDALAPDISSGEIPSKICRSPFGWPSRNHARITEIRQATVPIGGAPNDLEALARSFEDQQVIDDGTLGGRLDAVLLANESALVPGLEGSIEFSDVGFRGDHRPGGQGFKDPHPSSRNQVGHFLTGVGLGYDPSRVSQVVAAGIPLRILLGAPSHLTDEQVTFGLMIGHEKAADPDTDFNAWTLLNGFRLQYTSASQQDILAFQNAAEIASGNPEILNMAVAEEFLSLIRINTNQRGNSIQDLRLTMVAWIFGRLVRVGYFQHPSQAANWLRENLGEN